MKNRRDVLPLSKLGVKGDDTIFELGVERFYSCGSRWTPATGLAVGSLIALFVSSRSLAQSVYATPYTISTYAGTPGVNGFANGARLTAQFSRPTGLVVDAGGNMFVVDEAANSVRKITASGIVSVLAGTGQGGSGSADGTGSVARFSQPHGVAVDESGNLYVADSSNHLIRKITAAGVVTTLAGAAGSPGSANGVGSAARFNFPRGVAVDGSGNVYVADWGNYTVRKISKNGTVTTLAGLAGVSGAVNGMGAAARLGQVVGIAVDGTGNVYIVDGAVRKITQAGVVTTIAGGTRLGSLDATGGSATFKNPGGIAVEPGGALYVADTDNCIVRKITPTGTVTTLAGLAETPGTNDGVGSSAKFKVPAGIATDSAGNIFVADAENSLIRKGAPPQNGPRAVDEGVISVPGLPNLAPELLAPGSSIAYRGTTFDSLFGSDTETGLIKVISSTLLEGGTYTYTRIDRTKAKFTHVLDTSGTGYTEKETATTDLTFTSVTNGTYGTTGSYSGVDSGVNQSYSGKFTSSGTFTYSPGPAPATIVQQPMGKIASAGATLALTVDVPVSSSYQWRKDGSDISGATTNTLYIINAKISDSGIYDALVTPRFSSPFLTDGATVTINPAVPTGGSSRLVNLSVRTRAGSGDKTLIMGFVIAGNGSKQVLVRGLGPLLSGYGVEGALSDPQLLLMAATGQIASNDNWGGGGLLAQSFDRVGATPLTANSKDAALIQALSAGVYSAQIKSMDATNGIALAEIYDVDKSGPRLVNISARSEAGTGDNILVAGFVVEGNAPETLLIRGLGPTLGALGVAGAMRDPQLKLIDATGQQIAQNDNWGGAAALKSAFALVGAATLASDASGDAAIVVSVQPGVYSIHVSGVNGATGVALVEIYEIPE